MFVQQQWLLLRKKETTLITSQFKISVCAEVLFGGCQLGAPVLTALV